MRQHWGRRRLFCKICRYLLGALGWPGHVHMHKREFKRIHGRAPENWDEVLEWYGCRPTGKGKPEEETVKKERQTDGVMKLTDFCSEIPGDADNGVGGV